MNRRLRVTIHGYRNPVRRVLRKARQSGCVVEWHGARVRVVREFPHRTSDLAWRYIFELEVVEERVIEPSAGA